jgi:hypothetical protein
MDDMRFLCRPSLVAALLVWVSRVVRRDNLHGESNWSVHRPSLLFSSADRGPGLRVHRCYVAVSASGTQRELCGMVGIFCTTLCHHRLVLHSVYTQPQ